MEVPNEDDVKWIVQNMLQRLQIRIEDGDLVLVLDPSRAYESELEISRIVFPRGFLPEGK